MGGGNGCVTGCTGVGKCMYDRIYRCGGNVCV